MSKRAKILSLASFALLAATLTACGQKGPLYLPGAAPPHTQARPTAPPAASAPSTPASAPAAR